MRWEEFVPHKRLQPYIDRYWGWEGEAELPNRLPGTGHELMFHFETPGLYQIAGTLQRLPRAYLVSPRQQRLENRANGRVGFMAVRFRAGALRHFCSQPIHELADCLCEPIHLWGKQGAVWSQTVTEADSWQERLQRLEFGLLQCLRREPPADPWLDAAVTILYQQRRESVLQALPQQFFVSERSWQRKCKESVGVAPKVFQRLARFEHVMRRLLRSRTVRYLPDVLAGGYYDQAHFIRECKQLLGVTPQEYLVERNFRSHFYLPPRQRDGQQALAVPSK